LGRTAEIVGDDAVGVEVARPAIDEHERRPGTPILVEVAVIVTRRDDDDPIDASLAERPDQLALALGILVAAAGEDEDTTLARRVFDRAVKLGRERVRYVLENKSYGLRFAAQAAERRRVRVTPVVELVDGAPDPGLELRTDSRLRVDDARDRLQGDAGESGDVDHRWAAHLLVFEV
jgi:hypothetical protein